jgi:hypothetical protein
MECYRCYGVSLTNTANSYYVARLTNYNSALTRCAYYVGYG